MVLILRFSLPTLSTKPSNQTHQRNKVKSFVNLAIGGGLAFVGYNLYDGDDKFYDAIYKTLLPVAHRWVAPEFAHFLGRLSRSSRSFRIAGGELPPKFKLNSPERNPN